MFGKTKINNEQYYGKKVAVGNGKFVGGNISLIPNQELIIDCHEKGIYIHQPFSIDGTFIPYEKILEVSFKTEEQIQKDVTLTRLLLFGVFAFGLKKKTVNTKNFIVMNFKDGKTAIFEVSQMSLSLVNVINRYINKSTNSVSAPMTAQEQIKKLEELLKEGKITKEQFKLYKEELLNR